MPDHDPPDTAHRLRPVREAERPARRLGHLPGPGGRRVPRRTSVRSSPSGDPRGRCARAARTRCDFDARMRRARAVVLAEWRLEERTLAGSPAFEIATRARQAGVPAYALTATNGLSPFDARILDLQAILEASTPRALQAAARRLARSWSTIGSLADMAEAEQPCRDTPRRPRRRPSAAPGRARARRRGQGARP